MSLLVETLKIENGNVLNISFHNERMNRTLHDLFGLKRETKLENVIKIPDDSVTGIYKCRVIYDAETFRVEFQKYVIKHILNLKIIIDNSINYQYKFTNREAINSLMAKRGECDDILIIKDGMVTDTSYSNVVLRKPDGSWVTPYTCLLPGTKRAGLLNRGTISECEIKMNDLKNYTELKLINAMLDPDDTEGIPISGLV
jgi:4-amino-4-deoxychorismate lyase